MRGGRAGRRATAAPAEDAGAAGRAGQARRRPATGTTPPAETVDRRASPTSRRRSGEAFARAPGRRPASCFGFAEHELTTTYLGTSTGLRLRHDQPTGRVELNGKSADCARSAWAGAATRDFTDVDVAGAGRRRWPQRLGWAERRVDLPAGRYETLLPPTAVADLMIYLYWSAGARDAARGPDGVQPSRAAAPGSASGCPRLPLTLCSDPAAPGLECAPFVVAHASGRDASVFDNGLAAAARPTGSATARWPP